MVIYKLPPREVWDKYSNPYRFNMIKNYHIKLAKMSDWRVRVFDNDKGYSDTYYLKGELDDIIEPVVEVTDCNWTSDDWNIKPLKMYISRLPSTTIISEEYYHERTTPITEHGYNGEMIGVKVNGYWKYKHFSINSNYVTCNFENDSWSITKKGVGNFGYNSSGYFETIGGLDTARTEYIKKLKNEQFEAIQWIIDKMKSDKYKGFYDDIIEHLKNNT